MSVRTLLLASAALLGGAAFTGASASIITYQNLPSSGNTASVNGFTVATTGGNFERKTIGTVTGVGVSGGSVGGEIDGTETLSFTGGTLANRLNGFTVAFLYAGGNMGDANNEVAILDVNGNVLTTITLTANSGSGMVSMGTVENLSPGTNSGSGEFRVSGLNLAFTSLVFKSGNAAATPAAGDFAFVDLSYTAVPEPASMALLGIGLVGAGFLRRKKV